MKDKQTSKLICLVLACICMCAFFLLLALVVTDHASGFDDPVRTFFYDLRSDGLTKVLIVLTNTASFSVIALLCLILLLLPWTRLKFGIPLSAGMLASILTNHMVKDLVARPRPDVLHLVTEKGFSFPSGHSVGSMFFYGMAIWLIWHYVSREKAAANPDDGDAIAGAASVAEASRSSSGRLLAPRPLPPYHKRTAILLTILLSIPIVVVGPTRIYLGVHFPTDVLGGWCLAGFTIAVEALIIVALEQRRA